MATHILPTYARFDLAFERGEGCALFTADGRRYLDFTSGIAVNALGHAHPHLVAALGEQAAKLRRVSNIYNIPGQERLAARLCANSFADLVFFTNSGAEAVECAIKMARKFFAHRGQPQRHRLIAFEGAFHGRTLATIAAAGQQKYLDGFAPSMPGFDHVPFGDIDAARAAIGEETAGFIIEPVQGEGGVRPAPAGFLKALRAAADEHGLLLVLDEVQCGMGRTGQLFAHQRDGVTPDIMALAKGIGGGFPLGACLASAEAASGMAAGSHGSTYGGNPLAMAVGNAVLDIMLEKGFLERVNRAATLLRQKLAAVQDHAPGVIEEVRGEGLLLGLKCRVPNTDLVKALHGHGLLTVGAGDNVVRLLPPLIVSDEEISEAADKIAAAAATLVPAGMSGASGS